MKRKKKLVTIGNSLAGLKQQQINFQIAFVSCCYGLNVYVPSHMLKPLIPTGGYLEVEVIRS